jgi:RNA polymerase-interacting CarD/CdnL/TRCF family regulator
MYKFGTLVLYDKRGVYKVKRGEYRQSGGAAGDYYALCAVFSNSNEIIYTPVDMTSSMRPLISGGEAAHYLELFAQLEPHMFRSGKPMDLTTHYRDLLASRKVEDCLLLIKEIYVKQREMVRQKKSPRQADTQYLKLAEKLIC